jgi:predicted ester cyclase
MSTEENKAPVRCAIAEVWNQGQVVIIDELYVPPFSSFILQFPNIRTGEGLKHFVPSFRSAFPDIQITIADVIAEGDRVVLRCIIRGTNTGEFVIPMPLAATGKQKRFSERSFGRVVSGKFVGVWDDVDNLSLLRQLRVLPAPGESS